MSRYGIAILVLANVALCALAILSYHDIEGLSGSVLTTVSDMNDTLREQRFTGLVFRFDGGAVELHQKVGQSMEAFVAEYQTAVREYLETEAR